MDLSRLIGRSLSDGRRWWYCGPQRSLTVQLASWRWSVGFHIGDHDGKDERGIGFHVGFVYVTLSGFGPRVATSLGLKRSRGPTQRHYGVSLHGGAVWVDWAHDYLSATKASGKQRQWMDYDLYGQTPTGGWTWSWSWLDALLGKSVYSSRPLQGPGKAWVYCPEGRYEAIATIEMAEWRRPRWPWPARLRRLELNIPSGIPVPGKGENSWDCGDDATYGVTMSMRPGETLVLAIQRFVRECILRDREKYANASWTPREAWAKAIWEKAGTPS
jgi:hypothetical protein